MKQLFLVSAFLLFSLAAQAQPGGLRGGGGREMRAERLERVKAARQAFIAEKLELTVAEADAFFPIFWQYEEKMRKELRERDKKGADLGNLTEAQALDRIRKNRAHRQRMEKLKTEAEDAFLKVIPARKLIRLPVVEKTFRQRLWERAKGFRESRKN